MMETLTKAEEMPKAYDPKKVESRLYEFWEKGGFFKPRIDPNKRPFVISMPPPNVTGELHLGHAIVDTIEDIMIRWHRMKGDPTLWLPGSDHASIAVHYVIDKGLTSRSTEMDGLLKDMGFPLPAGRKPLTRQDLGREWFLKLGWAWRERYGGIIKKQHERLGASCDWSRERFTMDPGLSRAVRESFVRLYNKGLIYRGQYLANRCPRCGTVVSDLEVVHEEERGKLYYVRYPLTGGGDEYVTVATTRPETILGDTAVAKVTPAHDPTDYEIGQRHKLQFINVMNLDGTMNQYAGIYAGMDRFACRKALVAHLEGQGLLTRVEDYIHAIGHCQRCGTILEPSVSEQWFVKTKPLALPAIAAVRDGRIRIIPERATKIYYNWMENIRDWCISRQLWWGHRIPVWYCDACGKESVTVEETLPACLQCGSERVRQDPDILDTWFSSALWPFSTLGWPEETDDLKYFYPTSVLETGYDILFFWVARMIMMGLECPGDIPFDTVYLHGMIRDERGDKISKTKGNVVNPLDVMDEFGTDALRFTLATGSTPGNDMKLSRQKLENSRNFANKLWNAARFVLQAVENEEEVKPLPLQEIPDERLLLPDRWILSRHHRLCAEVDRLMADYQFGEAGRQIYEFLWGEFCDWYIEASKIRLYGHDPEARAATMSILLYVLERTLRLLHPFMPFVTEEIWQHLLFSKGAAMVLPNPPGKPALFTGKEEERGSIMVAPYPQAEGRYYNDAAEREMGLVLEIVRAIRNARAEFEVEPNRRIAALIAAGSNAGHLGDQAAVIAALARVDPERLTIVPHLVEKPSQALGLVVGTVEVFLPLPGMIDLAVEQDRLDREMATAESEIARAVALLGNASFVSRALEGVVEKEKEKLATLQERLDKLVRRKEALRA
ncbi:MAG: valine--tRNA ligase [Chloroflexi bacterium]|nr:valine--tRNA ligase [Chloroflexota bacterium]